MDDCAALVAEAARAAGATRVHAFAARAIDPFAAPERVTVAEAFARHAGIDLLATVRERQGRPRRCSPRRRTRPASAIAADDTWGDIFSRILAERIEPHLGVGRATIFYEYPLPLAALARAKPGSDQVAERFELYACGVELANALRRTDRRRRAARALRAGDGREAAHPRRALSARRGFPRGAWRRCRRRRGIALGFDRLVMLATGAAHIEQVIWTPVVETN